MSASQRALGHLKVGIRPRQKAAEKHLILPPFRATHRPTAYRQKQRENTRRKRLKTTHFFRALSGSIRKLSHAINVLTERIVCSFLACVTTGIRRGIESPARRGRLTEQ
jgi:hypothetical protein